MKFKKSILVTIIAVVIFLSVYIVYNLIEKTYSYSDIVNDDVLVNNIDKLNSILDTKTETDNPYYITEIVDENGNVPAYSYYSDSRIASRAINDLKAYDNKIFMGLGDYDKNTGPVKIIYYNTLTGKIESSGTIHDEEVLWFNIIDDKLYTTGADPRAGWGYGSYYVYNNNKNLWEQHQHNRGWVHVYDVRKYKDKIFMSGAVVNANYSVVQVSTDGGINFENADLYKDDVKVPQNDLLRCYRMAESPNGYYAYVRGVSTYEGIYKYDEINNQFNYLYKDGKYNSTLTYSTSYGILDFSWFNSLHFGNVLYKDNLYAFTGKIYNIKEQDNSLTFETIKMENNFNVQDAVIVNDEVYLLTYQYDSSTKLATAEIYKTTDMINFELFYKCELDSPPFAIEYYNNNFYIGGNYVSGAKVGGMYKLDLDNFKNKLSVDRENKKINIKRDAITYPINYTLYDDESVFETTLSFNKNMTKKEWKQEYTKFKNLNLIYSLLDNKQKINLDYSINYYDNIINSNINNLDGDYSNAIDFVKNVFSDEKKINNERFNISANTHVISEDEYEVKVTLTVPNLDKVYSDNYIVNEQNNFIYIGNEIDENIIKNNIKSSENITTHVDLLNNKLILKYNDNIIREYDLARFIINKNINNKSIYMSNYSDDEILSNFEVINCNKNIKDNIVQIKYNNILLDEYQVIGFTSNKISKIDKDIAYISNYTISELKKDIKLKNATSKIYKDKIEIKKDEYIYESLNFLSIDFDYLTVINKNIIIPSNYSYEQLSNDIAIDSLLNYKIVKDNVEITEGIVDEYCELKIYYKEKEIDSFSFSLEFINFDENIIVVNNSLLTNIKYNTTVSKLLEKITTSGYVSLKNNKNELITNNDLIGTGSQVLVKFYNYTDEYIIIVNGDIDGDGLYKMSDVMDIGYFIYEDKKLDYIYKKAADYDNNLVYNLEDVMKVARALIGDE